MMNIQVVPLKCHFDLIEQRHGAQDVFFTQTRQYPETIQQTTATMTLLVSGSL